MLNDNENPVPEKRSHGYRFWVLRCRRKLASISPHVFDYIGYSGLMVLSLWALFYGLGDYGIINGNESLYVEAAREMLLSGNWAVPTLNGLPYLKKPPLFIWLIMAATSLSSYIELPPRLVTASAALLLVLRWCASRFSYSWAKEALRPPSLIEINLPGAAVHIIVNEHILRFLGVREPHDYYTGSPLYYVPRLFLSFFPWAGILLFSWIGRSRDVSSDKQQVRRFVRL